MTRIEEAREYQSFKRVKHIMGLDENKVFDQLDRLGARLDNSFLLNKQGVYNERYR